MSVFSGTPRYKGCVEKIVEDAIKEASIYVECNVVNVLPIR